MNTIEPRKSIYQNNGIVFNTEGSGVVSQIPALIQPILDFYSKMLDEGYSPTEIRDAIISEI